MLSEKININVESLPKSIVDDATYIIRQPNPNSYSHGMFKYPCKFIPEIPRWAIKTYFKDEDMIIFDPFSGSGTTLLEANINGLNSFGTEIDDIAKLIIKVKTTRLGKDKIDELDKIFDQIMYNICNSSVDTYRPLITNLEHWFQPDTINQLGRIKNTIGYIENVELRNFFQLCMVSIIKKVSKADDASPKPYVSRKIIKKPADVKKEFTTVFGRYKQMMIKLNEVEKFGKTNLLEGNALNFDAPYIDLAITSPPYINAFDYGRTMRLENLWLGTLTEDSLREKKSKYVGTEKINIYKEKSSLEILNRSNLLKQYYFEILNLDERRALIVKKFFEDMEKNLLLVYKHLKDDGKFIIVIGNSNIRKVNIESWKVLNELASNIGFVRTSYFSYLIQNPYIRIPRNGRGGKVNKDFVLVLEKEA